MSKMVQIEGVSVEELMERITKVYLSMTTTTNALSDVVKKTTEQTEILRKTIDQMLVDRKFIKRNLRISDRRIFSYEREGVLIAQSNMKDTKTTYYRFSDFRKVMELEHKRLYPTNPETNVY